MMRASLSSAVTPSRRVVRCCVTAFSAFGTLTGSAYAFAPHAVPPTTPRLSVASRLVIAQRPLPVHPATTTAFRPPRIVLDAPKSRLLSSRRNYDYDPDEEDKDKSFLTKAADKVKSFLPSKWFKSDKEKKAELAQKRAKEEITGGISEVLKDAPLPVRMMGKMMGGVLSNVASGLAATMAEQNRRMEDLMDDARRLIVADSVVVDELGEPVVIGTPFSQSSSTATINGKTTVRVQSSFEVMGSKRSGVATMTADEGGIQQLSMNVGGRTYDVGTVGRPRAGSGKKIGRGAASRKGDVIDAEIIDAEFTEKK